MEKRQPQETSPVKASGLFVEALEAEGVEYIFGISGEENLGPLNSLKGFSIRLILTRHEQAAREGGKPLIDSRIEVARAIDGIRLCVDCLRTEAGEVVPMGVNAASAGRLVTDPRVAFLSFIGSARVGWMLRSKLAPGTCCALEHGGAAPVFVLSRPGNRRRRGGPRFVHACTSTFGPLDPITDPRE